MTDWKKIQENWPVNRELIWLNNCGTTPAGTHIVQAVNLFMEGYARKGLLTDVAEYADVKQRIKKILAELLRCHPEELALIHNTSEGMNHISHGLNLKSGDEIILPENEYPSNVYPWQHWEEKGVLLKTAPMRKNPEAFYQQLQTLMTEKTKVISMSAVHWCTGMPLPLERMGKHCREKGILFVVDGAQGVGMQPFDMKKMGIDAMAFSAWKWLMGPLGMGILYISKEKLPEIRPIFVGTESVVRDREYLPYKKELKAGADRFTISTSDFINWVYFLASLEYLRNIGFDAVRERIFELNSYLQERLRMIGFRLLSDEFPDYPTGISVCEKQDLSSDMLVSRLQEEKIIAAERLGRIRLSPHIYLSRHQLDEAVRGLSQAGMAQLYSRAVKGG